MENVTTINFKKFITFPFFIHYFKNAHQSMEIENYIRKKIEIYSSFIEFIDATENTEIESSIYQYKL